MQVWAGTATTSDETAFVQMTDMIFTGGYGLKFSVPVKGLQKDEPGIFK